MPTVETFAAIEALGLVVDYDYDITHVNGNKISGIGRRGCSHVSAWFTDGSEMQFLNFDEIEITYI